MKDTSLNAVMFDKESNNYAGMEFVDSRSIFREVAGAPLPKNQLQKEDNYKIYVNAMLDGNIQTVGFRTTKVC